MKIFHNLCPSIISLENLFESWHEFAKGKRGKLDVQIFERNLENNLFQLHEELKNKTYRHGNYTSFYITDPKVRHIHKAIVRDRVVHHAVYRILYPIFDRSFIFDSYSCRNNKGTHQAIYRLERFIRKVSKNYTGPCFALKCDVRKFFASINHDILMSLMEKKIKDQDALWLVKGIIRSFPQKGSTLLKGLNPQRTGMPIGNLTSQLFANVYLNELDHFVKYTLKAKHYIRYCDDFVVLDRDKDKLIGLRNEIEGFLISELKLYLHGDKVVIRRFNKGIDFLGYVTLPHHRVLRTKTKKRMFARVTKKNLPSYLGVLKHCNGYKLEKEIRRLKLK